MYQDSIRTKFLKGATADELLTTLSQNGWVDNVDELFVFDHELFSKMNLTQIKSKSMQNAVNTLNFLGDNIDGMVLSADILTDYVKLYMVNDAAKQVLIDLKDDLDPNDKNYSIMSRGINLAIVKLDNKALSAIVDNFDNVTITGVSVAVASKYSPSAPYIAWFQASQSITKGLVGNSDELSFKLIQQVRLVETTSIILGNRSAKYISNPTWGNQKDFEDILKMYLKFTRSAIDLDIASDKGGLLFYVADGIYYLMEDETISSKLVRIKDNEYKKIEKYQEYLYSEFN